MLPFIDLSSQQKRIKPQLDAAIAQVLEHGKYIMGPEVFELEERLAEFVGVRHCVSVSSGTDSLLIALMALGIGPGDEVITVPYTWIATAEVIPLTGATPVFVDIQPDTWNLDASKLESAINEHTKAIIPVGIYGQTPDMTAINAIAKSHGDIPVIEDAAQSFGATHHGKRSCGLSLIGSTSFFPTKPLGCYGDGGALFTDHDELAAKMRQLRSHGQESKHEHPIIGMNARLDTIQAAILLEKLKIFEQDCCARREVAKQYESVLGKHTTGQTIDSHNESVYAQFTVLLDSRDIIRRELTSQGIPTNAYYTRPLHLQGAFRPLAHRVGDFPVSESVAHRCLSLPMNPDLGRPTIQTIGESVIKAIATSDAMSPNV